MTDKQKTLVSLTLVVETCNVVLDLISHPQNNSPQPPPELSILHNDILSLLSLLDNSTTKLALALKPSSPTYSASLGPLRDISSHISALGHCASLLDPITHGATLIKEIASVMEDVIESVKSLAQTLLALDVAPNANTYLVKVGIVHEIIDKARTSDGILKNNLAAVRKKWAEHKASLEDGLREVGEMIDTGEALNGGDVDDQLEINDGWDELGLGSVQRMGKEEVERAKTVRANLHLATVLHERIDSELLSSSVLSFANASLDDFLCRSSALLSAADELVSTLYAPQDPSALKAELDSFVQTVEALRKGVQEASPQTGTLMTKLGELTDFSSGTYPFEEIQDLEK